jgi:long-chain acyl-CoA synthetase
MTSENYSKHYENYGVGQIDRCDQFANVLEIYNDAFTKYNDSPMFTCMGRTITYNEFDQYSQQLAAYLQSCEGLEPGDRVAIMIPNIIQQPVAAHAVLRAGFVMVNTNPLYTARELEHQLNDSGAKAILVLANMASVLEKVIDKTPIKHVIVTELGDMNTGIKRHIINNVVKYVKKLVPAYSLPNAVSYRKALSLGRKLSVTPVAKSFDSLAVLQYTGGTTGLSKGAMLTHANLVANTMQISQFFPTYNMEKASETCIQPLPLYHIYAFLFTVTQIHEGNHNVLIPNPRDIPGFVALLEKTKFTVFCGLNTLFVGLLHNKEFCRLDFQNLKFACSGGMALTKDTAEKWEEVTGTKIGEGYGLTECSPVVTFNPGGGETIGSIGIPLPLTQTKIIDDQGNEVPNGESGELCVKGPQVMAGYWNNEKATAGVFKDGWLLTGDVALIKDDGYHCIVDRKKDMIIVSGFNVYPNEVEDVLSAHPAILECAVVGVQDERQGEAVKAFIVMVEGESLTEEDVIALARENLTGYKVPKHIEFRTEELPKTNVGKILRRQLREN